VTPDVAGPRWRGSIRLRLTVIIVALTGVLAFGAAWLGGSRFEVAVVDQAVERRLAEFEGIDDREGLAEAADFGIDLLLLDELGVLETLEGLQGEFNEFDDVGELSDEEILELFDEDDLDVFRDAATEAMVLDARRSLRALADVGITELIFDELAGDDGLARILLLDANVVTLSPDLTPVGVEELAAVEPDTILVPQDDLFDLEAVVRTQFETDGIDDDRVVRPVIVPFDDLSFGFLIDLTDELSAVDSTRIPLWVAAATLVVLAGAATWMLTGRALEPVGAITRRVDEISAGNLGERVPDPGTADEIAMLARTMNGMLGRLDGADRQRRQFVSDASHELRTPVAVLRSEAEVAVRAPETTSVPDLAGVVLGEASRLEGLVEDLLALTRFDERDNNRSVGYDADLDFDVDDVVLAESARSRRLPVDRSAVSAGRVRGIPADLARAVGHLLDNAARHGRSRMAVGVTTVGNEVLVWVDDDGAGVAEGDRDRIFERFVRLDEARDRDRGGAGLGLAVVAETAAALGGSVSVASSPLGGARFELRLPAS
jgi:signal transduction histidine kinase